MVVGDQIAQRSRHQQLSLAPYPAAEHRPPPAPLPPTSESDQQGFFNRPRVHFARNALAHAGIAQRRIVSAWIGTTYAEPDADGAKCQWRTVSDQLRPKVPKLA